MQRLLVQISDFTVATTSTCSNKILHERNREHATSNLTIDLGEVRLSEG